MKNLPSFKSPFAGKKLLEFLYHSENFTKLSFELQYFFILLLEIVDWGTYDFFISFNGFKAIFPNIKISHSAFYRYIDKLKEEKFIILLKRGNSFNNKSSEYRVSLCAIEKKANKIFIEALIKQNLIYDFEEYYRKKYNINITEVLQGEFV